MPKRFDRHVLASIGRTSLAALLFLLVIDVLVQLSGDFNDEAPLGLLLRLLLWQLPERLVLFLPASLLIGAILGLGALARDQELTVVLAAGVSRWRLARGALLFALFSGLLALAAQEVLSEPAGRAQAALRAQLGGERPRLVWLKDPHYLVRIDGLRADGGLGPLRLYHYDREALQLIRADGAHRVGASWQLENARRRVLSARASREEALPDFHWANGVQPATLQQLQKDRQQSSLGALWALSGFLRANGLDSRSTDLQLYQRLALPLTALVMILLALPFVFGNQRSAAQGTRLVVGILLGTGYYLVQAMLANLALLLAWPPALAVFLPNLAFALGAVHFIRRS